MSSSSEPSNSTVVGRFRYTKGCILYESEQLQFAAQRALAAMTTIHACYWRPEYASARQSRDGDSFHLTLVTKDELVQLCQHYGSSSVDRAVALALESLEKELQPDSPRLLDLGMGHCCTENKNRNSESYYKVICWPDAAVWRLEHGLSRKDFHVTIGFRFADVHSVKKNHQTLIQPNIESNVSLYQFENVIRSVLRHLQAHRAHSNALEPEIDMLLHHAAQQGEQESDSHNTRAAKLIQALRAQCKLRSNQRRYTDVVAIADHILCVSPSTDGMIPVRALRALALLQLGEYNRALSALEETVALMEKKNKKTSLKRIELLRAMVQCRRYLDLSEPFCKFPRTEHLFDAGGKAVTRDDLIVPDLDFFLDGNKMIYVEEKVDGANVGFSLSPNGQILCQNRSHYVTASSQAQFQMLPLWLDQHGEALKTILEPGRHILFGEWCVMVHSLQYTRLPGYFLAFDLYDKFTGTFATRKELHTLLRPTGIPVVPIIAKLSLDSKKGLLPLLETQSFFRDGTVEGIYLRFESEDGQVSRRCKLVRPDFVSGMELHWSSQMLKKNLVCQDMTLNYDAYTEAETREQDKDDHVDEDQLTGSANGNLLDPRSRVTINLDDHCQVRMMRNFSFLIPGQLAVSSTPKSREHVDALRHLGVTLVVTLTQEEPLDRNWFTEQGIQYWFVPVPNYEPPTVEQMDSICRRVQQTIAQGGCVLEHCGGGKGRAGTVAACLLVRFGLSIPTTTNYVNEGAHMNSQEAIAYVRSARPGSLETVQQERFVQEYTKHVWKELAESEYEEPFLKTEEQEHIEPEAENNVATAKTSAEPGAVHPQAATTTATAPTKQEARALKEQAKHQKLLQRRAPNVVMLIGLPGSGKSTFAAQLVAASWNRVSQDELGRQRCEELAGQYSKQKNGKVVLDRCNVQVTERRHWLELMFVNTTPSNSNNNGSHNHTPRCVAVYFDVPLSICVERVRSRTDHPTIRGGTAGSERIVRGFYERLQVPTTAEGFDQVHVIRSQEDAQKLLQRWGA